MNLVEMLKDFLFRSYRGEIPTEDLIYVVNLLQNGIIDSFKQGKITREKMENILYSSEESV